MSDCSKINYTVAFSARSESYYNEIKNIVLCDDNFVIKFRDKFVIKHVRSIIATCKIQRRLTAAARTRRIFFYLYL